VFVVEEDGFADFSVLLHCAVYALVRRGVVVYVGQSKSTGERLVTHIRGRKKSTVKRTGYFGSNRMVSGFTFDQIWVRPCMLSELDTVEKEMIQKYQPKYNARLKGSAPPIALADLLQSLVPPGSVHSEPGFRRRA
jgi:excinuclease UvrABC nuclease subunit